MKPITNELKHRIHLSHAGLTRVSWNEVYDTEQELISDMFSPKVKVTGNLYELCKGYEYIKSFRTHYARSNSLTEKQISQLKRLAAEIAYHIYA